MAKTAPPLSSNRPHPVMLEFLKFFQKFALAIIVLTGGVTLLAWLIPALAHLLPAGWDRMKFNTAVLMLLTAASISLSRPRRSVTAVRASRLLGWFIAAIGALTFIECNSTRSFHIDTLFAADRFERAPGRMLAEIALFFVFSGFLLANLRTRKNSLTLLLDIVTLLLCSLLLLQTFGFVMEHLHLIEVPTGHDLSAPNALCIGLLGLVIFNGRMEHSWFAVFLGAGIAGHVARIAVPIAVAIPFALDSVQGFLIAHVKASPQFLSGLGATLLSVTGLCLVVILCRQINHLENQVRELSLRDELTGLYNRRGFYLLAEQAMRTARRAGDSFSICYFDLDGLKDINDTRGHEVGSASLQEMAQLMTAVFRETDILGRIGGDEFVAACNGDQPPVSRLAAALAAAAELANQRSGRRYVLSYSSGVAKCDTESNESLDNLLERADRKMYEVKRARKGRSQRSLV